MCVRKETGKAHRVTKEVDLEDLYTY
jgi:hypothetical protein